MIGVMTYFLVANANLPMLKTKQYEVHYFVYWRKYRVYSLWNYYGEALIQDQQEMGNTCLNPPLKLHNSHIYYLPS